MHPEPAACFQKMEVTVARWNRAVPAGVSSPMKPRHIWLICVGLAAGAGNAAPGKGDAAVWAPHDLIVDLHNLPRHYTCNDLWYRFKGILFILGARQDLEILPYRCEGNSPSVQLKFSTPRLVTGPDAHWSELSAVARTVKLEPGSPGALDSKDCVLLSQVKDSLMKALGSQVVSSRLSCQAPARAGAPAFEVTAKVLVPMAEASAAAAAPARHFTGCGYGYRDVNQHCLPVQPPPHAFVNSMGDDWACERGFTRKDDHCAPTVVPENAHLTTFGWECNRGSQQHEQKCLKIQIPPHAYMVNDTFSVGWDCERGFARAQNQCTAVRVPEHGFLAASGHEWRCDRGYVATDQGECLRVPVPPNGHLDETGHDFECNHGFNRAGNQCAAIRVPAHAYSTGVAELQSWQCDRGYARNGDSCVAVVIPAHAYLNDSGDGWSCDRGFHTAGQGCSPIAVPQNAHLDAQGNEWFCNRGFEKQDTRCTPTKSAEFALAQ